MSPIFNRCNRIGASWQQCTVAGQQSEQSTANGVAPSCAKLIVCLMSTQSVAQQMLTLPASYSLSLPDFCEFCSSGKKITPLPFFAIRLGKAMAWKEDSFICFLFWALSLQFFCHSTCARKQKLSLWVTCRTTQWGSSERNQGKANVLAVKVGCSFSPVLVMQLD